MQREIRPIPRTGNEETVPIRPDSVPSEPFRLDGRPRLPLTLYIYRVPGKKDLFLTQHKVLNDRPTAYDVNGCCYYVRYDDWPVSTALSRSSAVVEAGRPSASAAGDMELARSEPSLWRNMAQLHLHDQGLPQSMGCKMTLVSVDLNHDTVQEVAVMLDTQGRVVESRPGSSVSSFPTGDMFVDVYTKGYQAFGVDVAYFTGKAFTRRVFKADPQRPLYHFASPWQGIVSLEPQSHPHGSFKGYHRRHGSRTVDSILASELRSNLSGNPGWSTAAGPEHATTLTPGATESRDYAAQASKRMSRIRNRSSQLSDNTKDAVAHFVATGGRGLRMTDRLNYGLALAREPLGGGNGDEAKLGKLVLYPEAQAFNDLAVAVNLLLFNRMYERAMPSLHEP